MIYLYQSIFPVSRNKKNPGWYIHQPVERSVSLFVKNPKNKSRFMSEEIATLKSTFSTQEFHGLKMRQELEGGDIKKKRGRQKKKESKDMPKKNKKKLKKRWS